MTSAFALPDAQTHFARTLALGPTACPDGLFAGEPYRVMRGLKVHANTISHARLVALEDTFPRTRAMLGAEAFHDLSHGYFDAGHGRNRSLDQLGEDFPGWLAARDTPPLACELARFEWLWLESYHAAEAKPFCARDLENVCGDGLGALRLRRHPAARLMHGGGALAEVLGIPDRGDWLLIARPDADVLVSGADGDCAAMLSAIDASKTFSEVVETFLAGQTDTDPLPALQFLLGAGALTAGE